MAMIKFHNSVKSNQNHKRKRRKLKTCLDMLNIPTHAAAVEIFMTSLPCGSKGDNIF